MTTFMPAIDGADWASIALNSGPLFGGDPAGGFHTQGDVLGDKTADGVSLDSLWQLKLRVSARRTAVKS